MKKNALKIIIHKPLHEVFLFCITPPNSTKWIPSVVKEETNEWPVKIGTVYKLTNDKDKISQVTIARIKNDEYVEWISKDRSYHYRYSLQTIDEKTVLEYREWVDQGEIKEPFSQEVLAKLKFVLESQYVPI